MPRQVEYSVILKPSVEYLQRCGKLLLDTQEMADFLRVPRVKVPRLVYTDRIPLPLRLGLGRCLRWSVLELLEWVAAGCPRRTEWIEQRGWSGWARRRGYGLLW